MSFGAPGFGSLAGMWGGSQNASPVQYARLRDPRYAYAQALLNRGTETTPVKSPWEGVGRMGQALTGAYLMRDANEQYKGEESAYAKAIADALKQAQGTAAVTSTSEDQSAYGGEGPITRTVTPAVPGDMNKAIQTLSANQYAAPLAMQWQQREQEYQRGRADKREDTAQSQNFTIERDKAQNAFQVAGQQLQFAQQAAMQNSSQENQAALQRAQQTFTGAQNDLNRALEGLKINSAAGQKGFERADKLRDEYNNLTKDFRTVQDAYSKIQGTSDTGAGDMSMLYSYVKLLDPGSVVRESEFATAAASGSLGERIQGLYNRVASGERLPASLRQAFKDEATSLYKAQKGGADRLQTQYEDLAKRYGVDPKDVIQSYVTETPAKPAALSPQDQQALDWATANPNDPRAGQIRQRLGR